MFLNIIKDYKEDGRSKHRLTNGLDDINAKLDKIMQALKIK